jgi:hypothetical protein
MEVAFLKRGEEAGADFFSNVKIKTFHPRKILLIEEDTDEETTQSTIELILYTSCFLKTHPYTGKLAGHLELY